MVKCPAWKGDWVLTAGEYYSSGSYHGLTPRQSCDTLGHEKNTAPI